MPHPHSKLSKVVLNLTVDWLKSPAPFFRSERSSLIIIDENLNMYEDDHHL